MFFEYRLLHFIFSLINSILTFWFIGVLPKSTNAEHIKDNIGIFDFEMSEEQMSALSSRNRDLHYAWNPDTIL